MKYSNWQIEAIEAQWKRREHSYYRGGYVENSYGDFDILKGEGHLERKLELNFSNVEISEEQKTVISKWIGFYDNETYSISYTFDHNGYQYRYSVRGDNEPRITRYSFTKNSHFIIRSKSEMSLSFHDFLEALKEKFEMLETTILTDKWYFDDDQSYITNQIRYFENYVGISGEIKLRSLLKEYGKYSAIPCDIRRGLYQ